MYYIRENAKAILEENVAKYNRFKELNLKLDMSRGKPCVEQLDLTNGIFDVFSSKDIPIGSQDYRNYGIIDGIPEAKELFGALCGVEKDEIMVLGNSSLTIMYDTLQRAMQFGVDGNWPFTKRAKIKWLCPVPGYDRHFAITELFGIEMINVPMLNDGPDMNVIEEYVENDSAVKGVWCVPKYSNPQGIVYSDETVIRFAKLKPAANDFRIYWDNAYMVHHLGKDVPLLNLLQEAKKYGNEDMVYMFGSTSKISFSGSGIAFLCASKHNIDSLKKLMFFQMIGPDKIAQYAHVKFFGSVENLLKHMDKQAELLKPKFKVVSDVLNKELKELCQWVEPRGGYFFGVDLPTGTAKRTVELCKEAGVVLTEAGATYPYKNDPNDTSIRIAPSMPSIDDLTKAMEVFACCVKIAWAEKEVEKE